MTQIDRSKSQVEKSYQLSGVSEGLKNTIDLVMFNKNTSSKSIHELLRGVVPMALEWGADLTSVIDYITKNPHFQRKFMKCGFYPSMVDGIEAALQQKAEQNGHENLAYERQILSAFVVPLASAEIHQSLVDNSHLDPKSGGKMENFRYAKEAFLEALSKNFKPELDQPNSTLRDFYRENVVYLLELFDLPFEVVLNQIAFSPQAQKIVFDKFQDTLKSSLGRNFRGFLEGNNRLLFDYFNHRLAGYFAVIPGGIADCVKVVDETSLKEFIAQELNPMGFEKDFTQFWNFFLGKYTEEMIVPTVLHRCNSGLGESELRSRARSQFKARFKEVFDEVNSFSSRVDEMKSFFRSKVNVSVL